MRPRCRARPLRRAGARPSRRAAATRRGGDADPASLGPGQRADYFEATSARRASSARTRSPPRARSCARRIPPAKIRELVDEGLPSDARPQLGARLRAVARREGRHLARRRSGRGARRSAAIIAVHDERRRARERLPKRRRQRRPSAARTRASTTSLDDDGTAAGSWTASWCRATEAGFKRSSTRATATTSPTPSATRTPSTTLEDDRLGHYYVDTQGAHRRRAEGRTRRAAAQLDQVQRVPRRSTSSGRSPARSPRTATASRSTRATDVPDGPLRRLAALFAGGESELLAENARRRLGRVRRSRDVGEARARARQLVRRADRRRGAQRAGASSATGLDLEADVYSWLGDVGGFVRGTTEPDARRCARPRVDRRRPRGHRVRQVRRAARAAGGRRARARADRGRRVGGRDRRAGRDAAARARARRGPHGRRVRRRTPRPTASSPSSKLGDAATFDRREGHARRRHERRASCSRCRRSSQLVDAFGEADAEFEQARPYLEAFDDDRGRRRRPTTTRCARARRSTLK